MPDNKRITQYQYQVWSAGFVFDGLRDLRYGQSFCNYFNINDTWLYYQDRYDRADEHIREHYVEKGTE